MASFLVRAFDLAEAPRADFEDVAEGSTHAADIDALAASGVTAGCGERRYCPRRDTTRAQMATFLNRARNLEAAQGPPPVVVPTDGSAVTIPAGRPFVARFETVTVEGGVGVFAQQAEIRLSETIVGADEHSRFEALAAPPIEIDFGGAQIAAPLTFRFRSDTSGLKPEYVVPAVWSEEIMAWVPTLLDRVIIGNGEIIVKVAPTSAAAASAAIPGDFRNAAAGPGQPTVLAQAPAGGVGAGGFAGPAGTNRDGPSVGDADPRSVTALPCWVSPFLLGCADEAVEVVFTVLVPAAWETLEDAARAVVSDIVDVGTDVIETAREYAPKVMDAIERGIATGLRAAVAFYERWVLPHLRNFLGIAADPPHCADMPAPLWVADDGINFSEARRPDPRLHMCSQAAAPDASLLVKAVNNRNFGYQLKVTDGPPVQNLEAEELPDSNLLSLLVNDANAFLIDLIDSLDGYHWPLSETRFEVPGTDDVWTGKWETTGETAWLDLIRLGSNLVSRAVDQIPAAGFVLDASDCVAPLTGTVELPSHWTATANAAGSCYSAAAVIAGSTVVGAPFAVGLEASAQAMELAVTAATLAQNAITLQDLLLERVQEPASLSVQMIDCDADQPDLGGSNRPDLDNDGIIDFCDDDRDGDGWLDKYDTDDRDGPEEQATRDLDHDWDEDGVPPLPGPRPGQRRTTQRR